MPRLSQAKASTVEMEGALLGIPGILDAGLNMDQFPQLIHSGKLDLINAVAEQGAVYIPFKAKVLAIKSRVRTACGTASGTAKLSGVVGGSGKYGTQAHATTNAAGTELAWDLTAVGVTQDVPAGEVLYFEGDGGATGTGDCDVTVVLVPAP